MPTKTATKRHRWPQHPKDPARPLAIPCRSFDRCLDCGTPYRQSPKPPCEPKAQAA